MPKRSCHRWLPEEDAVVERYARALAAGRYGRATDACRACRHALANLHQRLRLPGPERSRYSVACEIRATMRRLGLAWAGRFPNRAESAVVDRHVRRLVRGLYPMPWPRPTPAARNSLGFPHTSHRSA